MNRLDYLQAVIDSQKTAFEVFGETQAQQCIIIDVRIGEASFLKEKIAGATWIPLIELNSKLSTLDKTKKIYVTTWSSSCTLAKAASILLINNGFEVQEIAGGNELWQTMGLPMETINPSKDTL